MSVRLREVAVLAIWSVMTTAQSAENVNETAQRKVIAAFAEAENKRDVKALADLFARDSPDREPAVKRAAAEPGFWTEKTRPIYRVNAVRSLTADVATVDVTTRWYQSNSLGSAQWLFVLVKDGGEWKISAARQLCATPAAR